jgi:hypothetical protein
VAEPLQIELRLAPRGSHSRVFLNGEECHNVRAISVRTDVKSVTIVTLELINVEVDVTGTAYVETTVNE